MRKMNRRIGESITVGFGTPHQIEIRVCDVKPGKTVFGIHTTNQLSIMRTEDITDEQRQAALLSQHIDDSPASEAEINDALVASRNVV